MNIKTLILNNRIVKAVYKSKFYVDLGTVQYGWFSGKLTDLMAFLYVTNFFGIKVEQNEVAYWILLVLIGLFIMGYFIKNIGLYDTDAYVRASKDPVQSEILEAARKINKSK